MCLSKVFVREKKDGSVVVEEASRVIDKNEAVEIQTLFGEKKVMEGYCIKDVDLLNNCIILDVSGRVE